MQGQMTPSEPGITFPAWSLLPAGLAKHWDAGWGYWLVDLPWKLEL